ncbi:MAG: sn-glycerol-3-phosphate ABC transporter ATP-binding protein UgpC [Proteobacteria bacterium]|nr:sn-glycerol-3-phosphate ABC transporter ATP-binding protein UgpC [Pseudomonadota bacterium]MCP4921746.1 sn-glycerol-3-phosphate ABC transporter ATP-binding protein UgpC [Pseudomonadota bacterium]
MATVTLDGIQKSYGDTQVLDRVDCQVADGEFLVLVGPSGCGKSTLLRCIAGLEEISAGELKIDDKRMNEVAPRDRDVAMVFQSYALYPHMTVRENMAFGLKVRGTPKAEIAARVGEASTMLGLDDLLDRLPKAMSGGQRQRVAMGRAIVRRPKVFLFDEPLSNLDAALRGQMRVELKRLHRDLDATIVYVTHDQVEALTLADRILVLNQGVVQQLGTPQELFDTPANRFVAGFIGSPPMNFLDEEDHTLGVRPNDVLFQPETGGMEARVDVVEHLGWEVHVHLTLSGRPLTARWETADVGRLEPGQTVSVGFGVTHRFDSRGERL